MAEAAVVEILVDRALRDAVEDATRQRDAAVMGLEETVAFLEGLDLTGKLDQPTLRARLGLVRQHLQAAKT